MARFLLIFFFIMHIIGKTNMTNSFDPRLLRSEVRADSEEMALPHYSPPVLCPFVSKPFEDCYCASTSSMVVESTILFCGGEFQKCEIYCRHLGNA